MYICFAEYRIKDEHRKQYLDYTQALLKDEERIQLYEGTDQPNLFVEVWTASTAELAEQMKEERCSERSSWYRIVGWVEGGAGKLHVWTFKPAHAPLIAG
ncbi:hypothetical protein [Paenibacillus harenae]|uniref:hypothetical protein n=1 Tax=Paenibacillus harenae TaxID=306543 RepID=UPI0027904770|nr:hypothetical protein [Paenibacillus harenae]MDQ0060693.1 hypothetical protein [Paenibacillus harenae]